MFLPNLYCQVLPTWATILKLPFLCSNSSGISNCPVSYPPFPWLSLVSWESTTRGCSCPDLPLTFHGPSPYLEGKIKKEKRKPAQQTQIQVPFPSHSPNSAPGLSPPVPATSLQVTSLWRAGDKHFVPRHSLPMPLLTTMSCLPYHPGAACSLHLSAHPSHAIFLEVSLSIPN